MSHAMDGGEDDGKFGYGSPCSKPPDTAWQSTEVVIQESIHEGRIGKQLQVLPLRVDRPPSYSP